MRNHIRLLLLTFVFAFAAFGQTFSSGSTGADGVLDLTAGDRVVQLPDSGILNYTTVNIPAGKTLTFGMNVRNTPVVMLAQGAVVVSGLINLDASGRTPGPGGFYGGTTGLPGFGPGGGEGGNTTSRGNGVAGRWIGPLSLVPNIGGSGAGANSSGYGNGICYSFEGGGGGGAITIASSVSIVISGGTISTRGQQNSCGSTGADGAVRLVSNLINVSGSLTGAVIRVEAPLNALTYTGGGTPPVRSTINPVIVLTNPPVLDIISIGGYPVPSYSGSSFSTIDLLLPSQLADPIPVVVRGTNVPVGSSVKIAFSGSASATSTTAILAGTNASSTATVYVSGANRSVVTYLFVSTTFDATLVASLRQSGPDAVSKIEVASILGQKTTYRFLREDGSEVSVARLSSDLKSVFGF